MVLPAPLQLNSLQSSRTTGGLSSGESTTRTWIHLPISRTARTLYDRPGKTSIFGHYGIERIGFIASEKSLGKGEGGKNEDDEYFDLLPNI